MRSRTVTTVIDAPREEVFGYLSSIENLPDWATDFARELRWEEGKAKVVNGLGEFFFAIDADERTGVIDMYAGPSEDRMALFPTRAFALPGGATGYSFTMFQDPEMSDELFDAQYRSLQREFENIERRFS